MENEALSESDDEDDRVRQLSIIHPSVLKQRDWPSLLVIYFVTFAGDACRGVLSTVLWPLCQSLGGNLIQLGYLVSAFSVGRMVVSTRVGIISDQHGHRAALLLSSLVVICAGLLWANIGLCPTGKLPLLYLSQFLLGSGTGSLGATRSYVVDTTAPQDRTHTLAQLSALQYAGFSATSVIGASLLTLGASLSAFWEFSLPAYVIVFLGALSCGLLLWPFRDVPRQEVSAAAVLAVRRQFEEKKGQQQQEKQQQQEEEEEASLSVQAQGAKSESLPEGAEADTTARIAHLMILLNFSTRGVVAVYETQMVQTLLDVYQLGELRTGAVITAGGVLGTLQFLFYRCIWQRRPGNEAQLIVLGLLVMAAAQAFIIDWGPRLPRGIWHYIVAILLIYGVGYPVANSAALGVFSNLPKRAKGKAQGRFALAGSAARVIMPVVSGYLEAGERTSSFSLCLSLLGLSLAGVAYFYDDVQALCPRGPPLEGYSPLPGIPGRSGDGSSAASIVVYPLLALGFLVTLAGIGAATDWGGDGLWGWSS